MADRAEYDAAPDLNWSRLKLIEQSPAHFKYGYGDDSSGFALGTACHMAILEPQRFIREYVVFEGKVRRGKVWEAFETEQLRAGKSILNKTEYAKALEVRAAVARNRKATEYLSGGVAEFMMRWVLESVPGSPMPFRFECKGRGDYLSAAIVDLKTTKDASPREFSKACAEYGYFGQAAWYSDGYERLMGKRKPYVIVAVENSAPYVVQVYRVPEAAIDRGRAQYMSLLGKLDYCTKANFWGGYSEQDEVDIEVPHWFGGDNV